MPSVVRAVVLAIAALSLASQTACDWPPKGSGAPSSSTGATTPAGDPPFIESIDMSASAYAVNGQYDIFGSITYECDDDVVHTVRVTVPVLGKSYDYPAGDVAMAVASPFSFTLSADAPLTSAGDTNYEVTLITKGGVSSAPVLKTVTLL